MGWIKSKRLSAFLWFMVAIVPPQAWASTSFAQGLGYNVPPVTVPFVSTVNNCSGICSVQPGNFVGDFTVATLPTCNGTATTYGSVAYATDLGGGANNVKCINNFWQHFSLGTPQANSNTTTSTIAWTPLVSAPIQQLTGTVAALNTVTLQMSTTGLYPGYEGCVIAPPSVLGIINLTISGSGINLGILGGTHNCYVYNGTALVQVSS